MRRLTLMLATFTLAGCTADLQDGAYTCMSGNDTDCPTDWFCWSDRTCHRESESGSGLYAQCANRDDCVGSLDCTQPDSSGAPQYCSSRCDVDSGCPTQPGTSCIGGFCRPTCADGMCPSGFTCWSDERCRPGPESGSGLFEACDERDECVTAYDCATSLPDVPSGTSSFCTVECEDEGDCSEIAGTTCVQDYCRPTCEFLGAGDCPGSMTCWSDGYCRNGDEPGAELYDDCTDDADCQLAYVCSERIGMGPDDGRYCTAACDGSSDDCASAPDSLCVSSFCRPTCMGMGMGMSSCPPMTECRVPTPPMGEMPPMQAVCTAPVGMMGALDGSAGCAGAMACMPPGQCGLATVDSGLGVCGWACYRNEECPMGTQCVDTFVGMGTDLCLHECTGDGDCTDGLVCADFSDSTQTVCVPPAWRDATTLPLTRQMPGMP